MIQTPQRLEFVTKPYPHQAKALKFIVAHNGGGLQVPMRWGKSWLGINFAAAMHLIHNIKRVLVVTVTSGLSVWEHEIRTHCPVPYVQSTYNPKRFVLDYPVDIQGLNFLIVNFQNVYTREYTSNREWTGIPNDHLGVLFNPDLIIVDESHRMGNPGSVESRNLHRLGRKARFRLFMTGSMFHRNPIYVFGQMKFLDAGVALGSNFEQYKNKVAVYGGFGGYKIIKYRNLKWMVKQCQSRVYMEDYVPPRDAVHNKLTFSLTGRNLQMYLAMYTHGAIKYRGQWIQAASSLTKHLRLMQLCGGNLRLDKGYAIVGTDKLTLCRERLEQYLEQDIHKAVIGCRFLPELAAIGRLAKKLGFVPVLFHGSVPKGDARKRRIDLFNETKKPALFISQIAAGKESINLSVADTMMFYSLPDSFVDFDQFSKRTEVFGETRTLMYDYLLAEGTEDMVTYEAMLMKQDVTTYIVNNPEHVEALTLK